MLFLHLLVRNYLACKSWEVNGHPFHEKQFVNCEVGKHFIERRCARVDIHWIQYNRKNYLCKQRDCLLGLAIICFWYLPHWFCPLINRKFKFILFYPLYSRLKSLESRSEKGSFPLTFFLYFCFDFTYAKEYSGKCLYGNTQVLYH